MIDWARRLWWAFWAHAPRQLEFTRSGQVVVGLALAVGFAAINTGNNLLYLCWGLVLSVIALSGILSELGVRRLTVNIGYVGPHRAGTRGLIKIELHNGSSRIPAFALEPSLFFSEPGEIHRPRSRAERAERSWRKARAPYILKIEPGRSVETYVRWQPETRGRFELRGVTIRTPYPFGFFRKIRRIALIHPKEVLVAPRPVEVPELIAPGRSDLGAERRALRGSGDEYFGLRLFALGDDPRRVSWRRSAKLDRLVVVEHEQPATHEVLLKVAGGATSRPEDFERSLSLAGSLAERLLAEGWSVGMALAANDEFIAPQPGPRQRQLIFDGLARATFDDDITPARTVGPARAVDTRSTRVLRISGGTIEPSAIQA